MTIERINIMGKCRACGAGIVWIKTFSGKNMPCDAAPVYYHKEKGPDRIVTTGGNVLSCKIAASPSQSTYVGYIPHWSTCPKAKRFKKAAKRPAVEAAQTTLF